MPPTKKKTDGTLIQVRVTAEQKRVFLLAAQVQGGDLSGLVRRLMLAEVDRLRDAGKKL